MLDGAGAVQSTTSYDPWGVPTAGSTDPFGFTGELYDGDLVHLRARWYHPILGTFTSRDPFAGFDTLPYSLHPYQYAYSNPVLLTDPSGEAVKVPLFCPIGYWYDEDQKICFRSDWMPEWFPETAKRGSFFIIPGGGVAGVATGGQIGGQVAGQVAGQAGKKVLEELAKVCGAIGLTALSAWLGNEIVEDLQTDADTRTRRHENEEIVVELGPSILPDNLIALAGRFPQAQIFGVEKAESKTKLLKMQLPAGGLGGRISVLNEDYETYSGPLKNRADVVVAVAPDPGAPIVQGILNFIKPGGKVLILTELPEHRKSVLFASGGRALVRQHTISSGRATITNTYLQVPLTSDFLYSIDKPWELYISSW